jgi:hypothetical protein
MNKCASSIILLAIAGLVASQHLVAQESVTIEPAKDNSIYSEGNLSNGIGVHLLAGKTAATGGFSFRRALIQFDIASAVPAGATINSVSLQMNVSKKPRGDSQSWPFTLNRVTSDWGEGTSNAPANEGEGTSATTGDATWTHTFFPSSNWSTPGGDFEPNPSASTDLSGLGFYIWTSVLMAADVQTWLDNPSTNFGWIVQGPNVDKTARRFDSRENLVTANRPKLTINYTAAVNEWAGFPIDEDGRTVDTGAYMGVVDIAADPWVWVYDLGKYVYLPESHVMAGGGWSFFPN